MKYEDKITRQQKYTEGEKHLADAAVMFFLDPLPSKTTITHENIFLNSFKSLGIVPWEFTGRQMHKHFSRKSMQAQSVPFYSMSLLHQLSVAKSLVWAGATEKMGLPHSAPSSQSKVMTSSCLYPSPPHPSLILQKLYSRHSLSYQTTITPELSFRAEQSHQEKQGIPAQVQWHRVSAQEVKFLSEQKVLQPFINGLTLFETQEEHLHP